MGVRPRASASASVPSSRRRSSALDPLGRRD
jgi:hypothetical protein